LTSEGLSCIEHEVVPRIVEVEAVVPHLRPAVW